MNLRIMMRRLNKRNLWLLLLPFLLAGCQSYKKVPCFQNGFVDYCGIVY